MRTSKKLVITTVSKKYGKIVCGLRITLTTVQFPFFFNPPILTIQLPQFSFLTFLFLAISLSKFFFLSPTSVVTPFLSPLSYFFSKFRQHHCRNLFLSSFYQISLNSTHIINNLHFLQYSAKRLEQNSMIYFKSQC